MKRLFAIVVMLASASVGWAQTSAVIVFKGAQLIDGTGAPPIQKSILVIEGGRITAVGKEGRVHNAGRSRTRDRTRRAHDHAGNYQWARASRARGRNAKPGRRLHARERGERARSIIRRPRPVQLVGRHRNRRRAALNAEARPAVKIVAPGNVPLCCSSRNS